MTELTAQQELQIKLGRDRYLAHKVLFRHRHPHVDPPFRRAMIEDWHSAEQYVCDIAFRGSAKTTTAEEAVVILAIYQAFKYGVIYRSTSDLAWEFLHNVKREFEKNEAILSLYGDLRGQPWTDGHLELANGVVIKAMGRGESMRGSKGEESRPDFAVFDDIEDKSTFTNIKQAQKVQDWFFSEALPGMTEPSKRKVRVITNAVDEKCLGVTLRRPGSGFRVRVIPIEYKDEAGERRSSWPERFPLREIDELKSSFYAVGQGITYEAEYMCNPVAPGSRPFERSMCRVEPRVRTWQPVYCMYDPARTVGSQAATTGFAAWSWDAERLIVWDAWGLKIMPDQIIESMFQLVGAGEKRPGIAELCERMDPVEIGFEEDGLNQWALQPIRQEALRRGVTLPLKPMKAPTGKLDFIRAMQPMFLAGFVTFAKPLNDLTEQLSTFPTGLMDVPNALAYAWRMRPGAPIYDDFRGNRHVSEDLGPVEGRPLYVCLNATRTLLTALVLQVFDGQVRVLGDLVREGDPAGLLQDALQDIQLQFGRDFRCVGGPLHFDQYQNVGLRQAVVKCLRTLQPGVAPERGRLYVTSLLRQERRGFPLLMISDKASWVLNGFSGGYARAVLKQGVLADYPAEGVYKTLMEGLESFAGLMQLGSTDEDAQGKLNAETHDGRPYRSMIGRGISVPDSKGDWNAALRG